MGDFGRWWRAYDREMAKTLHLQVLGHLGDGPHELFAALLDLQGPEVLHTLQRGT